MDINYRTDITPDIEQIIRLYDNAGLPRPTGDNDRMQQMYNNSNLIVTAWHGDQLVGVARSITDWVWTCYLADLAVRQDYKKSGIGKQLIDLTKQTLGEQSMVLLLSVASALQYYPKVGFTRLDNAFIINREK